NAGTYTVVAIANSCTSTTATKAVTVNSAPSASFTTVADTFYLPNGTVNFTNTSSGTGNSYSWAFGNGNSSTNTNPQTVYTAEGNYTVTLIATNNGCSDTTTKVIVVLQATALWGHNEISNFSVYPNPANEQLNIIWNQPESGHGLLTIYNLSGQLVYHQTVNGTAGKNSLVVNLEPFASGLYEVKLQQNGKTQMIKFRVIK
ncbi:MAG: T9SS type A sorting domain-containing protein, partial [Bacteroidia bacterium]|nr:T9SS type A sorting domain-containing protein [Bacteroidia bacterium]